MRSLAIIALIIIAMLTGGGLLKAAKPETVVAGLSYLPPIGYWDGDNRPSGFAVEVLTEAARREGIRIEWRRTENPADADSQLSAGAIDIIPAGIGIPERRQKFFVSKPWWFVELSLFARGPLNPGNLYGKRLALASPLFRSLVERHFPGAIPVVYDASPVGGRLAATDVCRGKVDAALVSHLEIDEFLLNAPDVCRGAPLQTFETEAVTEYSLIAAPGRRDIAQRLRSRIDQMTTDGTLGRMATQNPPIPTSSATLLAETLRDRYDHRLLSVGLVSAVALLVIFVVFFLHQERVRRILERSEARYQGLFDTAATGIVHVDADSRKFIAVNQEFCRMTGYTREELLGSGIGFLDLTYSEDRQLSAASYDELVSGKTRSYSIEKRYIRKDGSYIWVRVDMSGVRADDKLLYAIAIIQDITERRRAEQALIESEDRLRLAIGSTELGMFDYYPQTEKLIWSDLSKRQFGLPPEAHVDFQTFLGAVHPEDRPKVETAFAQVLRPESGGRFAIEFRAVGIQDRVERWLSASARMHYDPQGKPVRFIGISLDVTAQKHAEEALRSALAEAEVGRRLLDAMMDNARQAIFIADAPGFRLRKVSRYALELLGTTAEKLREMPAGHHPAEYRMYRPGEADPAPVEDLPLVRATARGEVVTQEEWLVSCADGTKIPILCTAAPLFDNSGKVAGGVSGWQDITQRKRMEEALRESERQLREMADSMPQLVWIAGPDGGTIYCNRQWYEQLDVHGLEPLGTTWIDLLHPDDQEPCMALWRHCLEGGEPCQSEYRFRTAGGQYRWFLGKGVPLRDEQGRITRWFGTWTDIDDRRRAEERLRETQKLESIGQLAGGIAHDFNNLLTGILGNASLLADHIPPEATASVANIVSGAERAAHLTRQLLAYAGKGQFYVKNIDLSSAVRGMEELLRVSVPKDVEIRFDLSSSMPEVRMDPSQVQQIVVNLVINAGEAIGDVGAGTISIATGSSAFDQPFPVAVGEVPPGEYVWLEVADTGPGIVPAIQANIFDPFFTTKFAGRGLGLAAVAGIVRGRKGAVQLDSAPGRGSRFRVYFPLPAGALKVNGGPETPRGTVLVVEDQAYVRDYLTAAVNRTGYKALAAASYDEAVTMCREHMETLDMVILDVIGPGVEHDEILRDITARRPKLKVLLTSTFSEAEAREMCGGCKCAAFIQKPYSAQELADRLQLLLG